MRVDLDHLPDVQQAELTRVPDTLMPGCVRAISTATQPWKKNGRVLKIIVSGNYSREVGQTSHEFCGLDRNRVGG